MEVAMSHVVRNLMTLSLVGAAGLMNACEPPPLEEGTAGQSAIDGEELEVASSALRTGTWVADSGGSRPAGAMGVLQPDGSTLFVCAALHSDGVFHPGKLALGQCYYGWGGTEHQAYSYRVLIRRPSYRWVFNPGSTPPNAVSAPRVGGEELAVCTAAGPGGQWIHGKVYRGLCHVPWNGREEPKSEFFILVEG
jgi:hypothetical protein